MVGKICLYSNEDLLFDDTYNLYASDRYGVYDYVIDICTDLTKPFADIIANYELLNKSIDEFSKYDNLDTKVKDSLYHKYYNMGKELLEKSDYIEFDMEIEEIGKYIENNPLLKNKNIVISKNIDFNYETLNRINNSFKNFDNLFFSLKDNSKLINYLLFKETTITLEKMADKVRKYSFSPMEIIMFVYDMVRERVYVDVLENEDLTLARDLTASLLGKNIVCTGFVRIFNKILNLLGIETNESILFPTKDDIGHLRSEIFVKDSKYGIDGVYFFDPTYDCKKHGNNYLSSYRFFARTKEEMDKIDLADDLVDINFQCYSKIIADDFYELYKKSGFKDIPRKLIDSINHMSVVINKKSIFTTTNPDLLRALYRNINIEKTYRNIMHLSGYYSKPIYAETMLQVLFNVRKEEMQIDSDKYAFSIYDFFEIFLKSNWMFYNRDDILLKTFFGDEYQIDKYLRMREYLENSGMNKKIICESFSKKLKKEKRLI